MSAAFPSLGDPDIDFTKRPVPELSAPAEIAAKILGGIAGVIFFLLFCTFGLGGIFLVSAFFGD